MPVSQKWNFLSAREKRGEDMNTLILVVVIASLISTVSAQVVTADKVPAEVPKAAIDVLVNKFKGYKIVETESLQLVSDSKMIYEIHLDNKKEVLKALLYADGTILRQTAKAKKYKGNALLPDSDRRQMDCKSKGRTSASSV
jgi:hypothetical protein